MEYKCSYPRFAGLDCFCEQGYVGTTFTTVVVMTCCDFQRELNYTAQVRHRSCVEAFGCYQEPVTHSECGSPCCGTSHLTPCLTDDDPQTCIGIPECPDTEEEFDALADLIRCANTGSTSCCGCDWCCDGFAPCPQNRVYAFENLPISHSRGCLPDGDCGQSVPRPVCRRAEFAVGRRPTAHEPPCSTPDPANRIGRHELHSLNRIRARDLRSSSSGTDSRCSTSTLACDREPECRTYYGHVGRGHGIGSNNKHVGWLCGQENRCQASTKRANRCYPNKRADGRHSFECAYRSPCPEKPSVCL